MTIIIIISMYALLIPLTTLYIYLRNKGTGKDNAAVLTKGLCTTIVLAVAVVALIASKQTDNIYAILIIAGLAMGLAGDIALCNNFIVGMVFFGLGHLCYIPALVILSDAPLWALPIFAASYLAVILLARAGGAKPGAMLKPAVIYTAILIGFFSAAVSVMIGAPGSPVSWVALAGALMFTMSDGMIGIRLFRIGGKRLQKTIASRKSGIGTYLYFIAQSLMAVSVWAMIG